MERPLTTMGLAVTAVAFLASCSFQAGQYQAVGRDKLAQLVSDGLTKQVGQRPDNVTCPDDLPSSVGATTRCVLTAGTTRYGVTVRVSKVNPDKSDANELDLQVDQQPM